MKDEKAVNREGDVILIHYQDQPVAYARIEGINPDIKKDWYQMTLLLLTIPAQSVTWILRDEYINGASFTMGGAVHPTGKSEESFSGRDAARQWSAARPEVPGKSFQGDRVQETALIHAHPESTVSGIAPAVLRR